MGFKCINSYSLLCYLLFIALFMKNIRALVKVGYFHMFCCSRNHCCARTDLLVRERLHCNI